MEKRQGFLERIVWIIIGTLYCTALSATILSSTYVYVSFFELLIANMLFLSFLLYCTKSAKRAVLFLKIAAGAAVLAVILMFTNIIQYDGLIAYFQSLFKVIVGINYYTEEYRIGVFLLLCLALSIFTVLFLRKTYNFVFFFMLGIIIFITQISYEIFTLNWSFILFWFVIIVLFFKSNFLIWTARNKIENSNLVKLMLYVLPVCLIIVTASGLLSMVGNKIKLNPIISLNDIVNNVLGIDISVDRVNNLGFSSDTGRLGGTVEPDNTIAFYVNTTAQPTYLKGAVKTLYTGTSWKSESDEISGSLKDVKLYNSIREYGTGRFEQYQEPAVRYTNQFMHITLAGISYTVFNPAATYDVNLDFSLNSEYDIFSKKLLMQGASYALSFIQLENEAADLEYLCKIYGNSFENRDFSEAEVEKYTQLPKTVTRRTYELAAEITEEKSNKYDKIKAIEAYLATSFPYTMETPATPFGQDFVDYFLFDLKKGYCTYYASAMVVMCRSLGIPARYVQGFTMPYVTGSGGIYAVTNQRAHAWAEVYFDNVGWVSFEPTAGFNLDPGQNIGDFMDPSMQDPKYRDYRRDIGDGLWNDGNGAVSRPPVSGSVSSTPTASAASPSNHNNSRNGENHSGEENSASGGNAENSGTSSDGFLIPGQNGDEESSGRGALITLASILAVVSVGIFVYMNYLKRKKSIERKGREAVIYYYKELLKIFSKYGRGLRSSETMNKYGIRLALAYPVYGDNIIEAAGVFSKAVYSNQEIDDNSVEKVKNFYNEIKSNKRKIRNKK